jgi:hypothetical protein
MWRAAGDLQDGEGVSARIHRELLVQHLAAIDVQADSPDYFLTGRSIRRLVGCLPISRTRRSSTRPGALHLATGTTTHKPAMLVPYGVLSDEFLTPTWSEQ